MSEQFIIEKRGLYYRPNAQGYTGLRREAGRYSFKQAVEHTGPNGPDGPRDGISIWCESEAPEFSHRCAWDLKLKETAYQAGFKDALATDAVRNLLVAAFEKGVERGIVEYSHLAPEDVPPFDGRASDFWVSAVLDGRV